MAKFENADEMYGIFKEMADELLKAGKLVEAMKSTGFILQYSLSDPRAVITIDGSQTPPQVVFGETTIRPTITIVATADIAHQYMLKRINIGEAIMSKRIQARPMAAAMQLLKFQPLLEPMHGIYRSILEKRGLDRLLA